MSIILSSQVRKKGLGKEKYTPRPAQGRKTGLERKNKQLDPGNENYVNHFGESSPEKGSREKKIRFQTRPRKKNGLGERKICSQTREVQNFIRSPSLPTSSPLAFRPPTYFVTVYVRYDKMNADRCLPEVPRNIGCAESSAETRENES